MPMVSATRRASYTSSIEQQRPFTDSGMPSCPARRRWFQSCMVRPMTLRPSARSMAATAEESTPPDMATAMVSECSIQQLALSNWNSFSKLLSHRKFAAPIPVVILSEAKDLLSRALPEKQVLRFAQDDNPSSCRAFTGNDTSTRPHRRQLSQTRYRLWNQAQCEVYILRRILFPETETNAALRAVSAQPHRGQHVRRFDRAGRTRGAG